MPPTSLFQRAPVSNVCNTPSCLAASELVLSYVNFTADPCSDFYQYTCGSWLQSPPVVENYKNSIISSSTLDIHNRGLKNIARILNGTYEDIRTKLKTDADGFHFEDQAQVDKANFQFVQEYYNVCLNASLIIELGPTPIFADIVKIQKELFPLHSNATTALHLANTLAFFTRRGIESSLVYIGYDVQEQDHSVNAAVFGLPSIKPYSDYTLDQIMSYVESTLGEPANSSSNAAFIHQESQNTGFVTWSAEKVQTASKNFIELSSKIATASEQFDSGMGFRMASLNELNSINSFIDWSSLLNNLTGIQYSTSQTPVQLDTPDYLGRLDTLLRNTSKEIIQDFFIVDFMLDQYRNLYAPVNPSNKTETSSKNEVKTARTPLSIVCADDTSRTFPDAIGRYFVLETFGGLKEKQRLEDLVSQIHDSWLKRIPSTPWLDKETAMQAYNKIKLLKAKLAFKTADPDWREPNSIKSYFEGNVVDSRGYYYAKAAAEIWRNNKSWSKLPLQNPEIEWTNDYYPNVVNAFYTPLKNQIEIGAGYAQSPVYDSNFPEYLIYGGIGSTVGHELVHALDDSGRLYNGTGYEVNWWSNSSVKEFKSESKCFIDEYSKYEITDNEGKRTPVDGVTTLGENIADAGGASLAFNAYQEMAKTRWPGQSEPMLPGPEFSNISPEQLFFVSMGIKSCQAMPPQPAGYFDGEPHTLSNLRVNLPLQNLEQFATAFNCPVGSPMNPHKKNEDRCKIW